MRRYTLAAALIAGTMMVSSLALAVGGSEGGAASGGSGLGAAGAGATGANGTGVGGQGAYGTGAYGMNAIGPGAGLDAGLAGTTAPGGGAGSTQSVMIPGSPTNGTMTDNDTSTLNMPGRSTPTVPTPR